MGELKGGVITWYRAEHWLYSHHIKFLAKAIKGCIRVIWGGGNTT